MGLAEHCVEEFYGVDGVGAGAVENLLAAGGTRGDDDGQDNVREDPPTTVRSSRPKTPLAHVVPHSAP